MVIAIVVMLLFSTLFLYQPHGKYQILILRDTACAFAVYSAKTYPIFMELKR